MTFPRLLVVAAGLALAPAEAGALGSPALGVTVFLSPAQAPAGTTVGVEVRIVNCGDTDLYNVVPSPFVVITTGGCPVSDWMQLTPEGGGSAVLLSGPSPTCTAFMSPGQVTSYLWTAQAKAIGAVDFTITVTARELGGPGLPKVEDTATLVIPAPSLSSTVMLAVSKVNVGQSFTVEDRIMNTGPGAISTVVPELQTAFTGGAGVALISGPTPPVIGPLNPGETGSFFWSFIGTAPGSVDFGVTVTGSDAAGSGTAFSVGKMMIQSPSMLSATVTTSSAGLVKYGDSVTVFFDVFNSGDASSDATIRYSLTLAGSGQLTLLGCAPLATLCPENPAIDDAVVQHNSATRFTWLYRASGAGTVTIFVAAAGEDHNTGLSVFSNTASTTFVIPVPSVLSYTVTGDSTVVQSADVDYAVSIVNLGTTSVCQSGFEVRIEDQGSVVPPFTLEFGPLGDSLLPICYEPGQVRTFTVRISMPANLPVGIGRLVIEPVAAEAWTGTPAIAAGAIRPLRVIASRSGLCGLAANPWRPRAGPQEICYSVSPGDGGRPVTLSIYTLSGDVVRTLVAEVLPTGAYTAVWDGRNSAGQRVASGVYLVFFQSYMARETRKLAVLQ